MTALVNENGAVPPQDDANAALALPSVGTDVPLALETELTARTSEDPAQHSAAHAAKRRAERRFGYGLDLTSEHGENEYWRRKRVYNRVTEWGNEEPLIPPFTNVDLEITHWRPWEVTSGGGAGEDTSAMRQERRLRAVLDAIDGQHESRHWLYKHPFCRGCYPDETWTLDSHGEKDDAFGVRGSMAFSIVEWRYAHWLLRNGERGFPADEWDGVTLPVLESLEENLDGLSYAALREMPEPGWLIPEVLPDSGTGVLRARDQSFKSFMALSWALELVVNGGNVLYCAGEGANQFGNRIDAWLKNEDGPDHGGIVGEPHETLDVRPWVPNLFTADRRFEKVLEDAHEYKYDLIIIDTYSRAVAGSDPSSQADQAVVTARVDELARATGGTVLLVAHSQKSDTDTSGSIEIEDARDFVIAMKRSGSGATLEVTKQKDGVESPKPMRYKTKSVGPSIVLVPDEDASGGESIMSTKDWIVAALNDTSALGPRSETEILRWINDHEHRRAMPPLKRGTLSSALSREVGGAVTKTGTRYSLAESS